MDYEEIEHSINFFGNYDPESEIEEGFDDFDGEEEDYQDDFDEKLAEIDFSQIEGQNFKKSFSKINRKMAQPSMVRKVIVPENQAVIVEGKERFTPIGSKSTKNGVKQSAQRNVNQQMRSRNALKQSANRKSNVSQPSMVQKVIVPDFQKVIVTGKERFSPLGTTLASQNGFRQSSPGGVRQGIKNNATLKQHVGKKQTPSNLVNDLKINKGGRYLVHEQKRKGIASVKVPDDRKVIVQGVSDFILNGKNEAIKQIGYYKGERLKELVLIFNNDSAVDFEIELFNPSSMLDYLYSTSQNLNDKIQVASGTTAYSDVVYNLLANPTLIPNCKFVFSGPSVTAQKSQPLILKNKNIEGYEKIHPLNLELKIDTMQFANDIIFFDIMQMLNRPFIPDGMDVIRYKVLAGNTVTMAFFYKQVSLKKVFYKEARDSKILL